MANPVVVLLLLILVVVGIAFVLSEGNSPVASNTTSVYYTTTSETTATTTVSPSLYGNISIDSYSCTSTTDSYGHKYYNLLASGTATGPELSGSESAVLGVSSNPLGGDNNKTCGSWTRNSTFGWCYRASGDPQGTSWTFTEYNMSGSVVDQYSFGAVQIDAGVSVYNVSSGYTTNLASNSVTAQCS